MPWLTVIGIGDNGAAGLSAEARQALDAATAVLGARRVLDALDLQGKDLIDWANGFEATLGKILSRRGTPLAILATGDPMHFGIGATLALHVAPEEMRVIAAPSAFSLAAARLGWPLQAVECISLHGRPVARLAAYLADRQRIIALTSDGGTVRAAAALLAQSGYGRSRLTVLEHMGGERERVVSFAAADPDPDPHGFADFNTLAVECIADARAMLDGTAAGLPDAAFEHDGQLTKREVRAAVLAHLRPGGSRMLWDVGAGCGSIAIEWLRAAPHGSAVAIEPAASRIAMIRANAEALGVPHLKLVEGDAPEALERLAPPDAVFIGGGLTGAAVFETAWSALRPGGRLVATAVTLESEARLLALQAGHGGTLTRIAVTRAEPVGRFTGWKPLMPVTLWSVAKP